MSEKGMKRFNVNIVRVTEGRWKGTGEKVIVEKILVENLPKLMIHVKSVWFNNFCEF